MKIIQGYFDVAIEFFSQFSIKFWVDSSVFENMFDNFIKSAIENQ